MLFWIGLAIIAAGIIYALLNWHNPGTPIPDEIEIADEPAQIGDRLRILDANELISLLDLSPALANIKTNLGLSDENWHKDTVPLLHGLIDFVQRLPASESHHHAGDGGLIRHTLDVAALALLASAAHSFPPGAKTEEIARLTAAWRYGILVAALLHDVGKTLTGFKVLLFADGTAGQSVLWLPDAGSMRESGKMYYRVEFPDQKEAYSTHAELGWTFFQVLVPAHVRQWLATADPKLVVTLRQYLSGNKEAGIIHDLVKHADMTSVARDLKSGSRQRFASARRTPLIETVMDTLIEMLAERGAHFSIATTAGGDLFRKGDTVYLISKNVPDSIREYLKKTGSRAAPAFPTDNQRIFDTLMEYGAVIPNPHGVSKAITLIDVAFTRADGYTATHQFTVLAFALTTLYPSGDYYPQEFAGTLEIAAEKAAKPPQASATVAEIQPIADAVVIDRQEEHASGGDAPPTTDQQIDADAGLVQRIEASRDRTIAAVTDTTIPDIDALLMQSGLVVEEEETEAEDPANANNEVQPEAQATPTSNTTPPAKTESKAGKASSGINRLRNMFVPAKAVKSAPPTGAVGLSDDGLPESDAAATGMAQAQAMRRAAPTSTPRPVTVMQPSADALDALTALDAAAIVTEPPAKEVNEDLEAVPVSPEPVPAQGLNADDSPLRAIGKQFWNWLANGLADGSIPVNQSASPVHFVTEGMLLVSPAIFREYAGVFNKSDPQCPGLLAQRGFTSLSLHERTRRTALFFAVGSKNNKILFRCYLIPEKHLYHIIRAESRPANNPDLSVVTDDLLKQKNSEKAS